MSLGLPVICSKKVARNFGSNVISYKGDLELKKKIISIKNNKKVSNKFSKKSIWFAKKLDSKSMSLIYLQLLKF